MDAEKTQIDFELVKGPVLVISHCTCGAWQWDDEKRRYVTEGGETKQIGLGGFVCETCGDQLYATITQ